LPWDLTGDRSFVICACYFLIILPKVINKVAQYTTDNDHARRNKREDSWNFSESRYLISSKKIQRDDNNMQTHINSNNDHNIKEE